MNSHRNSLPKMSSIWICAFLFSKINLNFFHELKRFSIQKRDINQVIGITVVYQFSSVVDILWSNSTLFHRNNVSKKITLAI